MERYKIQIEYEGTSLEGQVTMSGFQGYQEWTVPYPGVYTIEVMGAGGGGFFIMAVPGNVDQYLSKVSELKLRHLNWRFEYNGVHTIDSEP